MATPNYNARNPAVKRIMQEIREMEANASTEFIAQALETDIFEWHFVVRGPSDTEFQGGVYHGRILLPPEYPFKPPAFMMLTPSGRFETNMKICLSISSHHPEHWQPSWSVRTALMALIAFMPSPGAGALGALDFSKEERQKMAARSAAEPPKFGSADRQRMIDDMHNEMLRLMHEVETSQGNASAAASATQEADPAAQKKEAHEGMAPSVETAGEGVETPRARESADSVAREECPSATVAASPATPSASQVGTPAPQTPSPVMASPAMASPWQPGQTPTSAASATAEAEQQLRELHQRQLEELRASDRGLSLLAGALLVCIAAMMMRKVLVATGYNLLGDEY